MSEQKPLRATSGPLDAVVAVPGSKSIANRALVVAALADGISTISNVPDGDDTAALLDCLGALGIESASDRPGTVTIAGTAGVFAPTGAPLHARLAGTTSRFATAIAALASRPLVIDGDGPLRTRPMGELHDALRSLGATVTSTEAAGRLPVTVSGPLHGGAVSLRGDVSSQFVTALMLIAPLLDGGLRIELSSELVSRPYVELTAAVMAEFGLDGVEIADRSIVVPAGRYRPADVDVEPDCSSASYPWACAAVRGGAVTVRRLTRDARQGDIAIVDLLAAMGCTVSESSVGLTVQRDRDIALVGLTADLHDVSDLVPTVAAVATLATTPSDITGVGFIRAKESDRLGDLAGELNRLGAAVTVTADGLHIEPVAELHGATLDSHHDHRLAMAFAVVATVVDGVTVADPAVVAKSWPRFWDVYAELTSSSR